jgi:acetyl esterase/lipase
MPGPSTRSPLAVLLYVHGGAWIISNRNHQGLPLMHEMAARGWVGVNADYRLSPWATFPDHLVDVKRAVAWIREHADEIGADPDFIAITGGSAGGHLAALAALTPNDPRYQPGFEDADTSLQACIPIYGVYDLADRHGYHGHEEFLTRLLEPHIMKERYDRAPERFHDASPLDQVRPDAPPFLVVHGAMDTLAPTAGARSFVAALREVSHQPVVYAELPGTQHAFDVFPSLRTAYVLQGVAGFLDHASAQARKVSAGDARVAVR